jgi:hypothetical protein
MRLSTRSHSPIEPLRIKGVLAIIMACLVALLILVSPWGLYELGLSNINGRPTPLIGLPSQGPPRLPTWAAGAASSFMASIALIFLQWGGAMRHGEKPCRSFRRMHRGHGREEFRAAFVAAAVSQFRTQMFLVGCPW